jgi:hypothetical protein
LNNPAFIGKTLRNEKLASGCTVMGTISLAESPNVIDVKEVAVLDYLRIDIAHNFRREIPTPRQQRL